MADPERAITILNELRLLGVKLAIDDFGTGYSSLAYLQRLPVTGVKIDKSFVSGLRRDDADFVIVRSTIEIARVLGLRTVAEGVEDEALWKTLADLGCDAAQGYSASRPIVGEQIPWLMSVLRPPLRAPTSSSSSSWAPSDRPPPRLTGLPPRPPAAVAATV